MKSFQLAFCAAVMAIVFPSQARAVLLLRYNFDEASGNALDTGGAPLTDAAFMGGATRSSDTPSGLGSSLDLRTDAPIAHLLGQDAPDLDGLSALTLTTWLKLDSYASGNNRLVSKQFSGMNFDGFSFNMNAAPNDGPVGPDNFRLGLFLGGSGGFTSAFSTADAAATAWTFLATTYDSTTGTVAFYTGGVGAPVTPLGATQILALNPGVINGLAARFGVGFTDATPGANTSAIGRQDDVRVYSTALSLIELEAIRLNNVPEPDAALLTMLAAFYVAKRRRMHQARRL